MVDSEWLIVDGNLQHDLTNDFRALQLNNIHPPIHLCLSCLPIFPIPPISLLSLTPQSLASKPLTPMSYPKVIFLDAVGTLFGVKSSVGQIYGEMARPFGVDVEAEKLDRAFFQNFKSAPPMAFPDVESTAIPAEEYAWWKAIATSTFEMAGVFDQFSDFDRFFADLYFHFATAEPWFVYPDVNDFLEAWRSHEIELGILSNFDSRIYPVLELLNLADFFKSVTISTEVGAAKPDPLVFETALQKHGCLASEAWHVGDSYEQDYEGSKAVGLKGVWLNRK